MKIVFVCQIKSADGWVCGVDMLSAEVQLAENATSNVDSVMMREVGLIQRNENSLHARKITELLPRKGSLTRKGET